MLGDELFSLLKDCTICPRKCHVNRIEGKLGFCKVNGKPMVSSFFPHHGEESVIRGTHGSGTIFFTGCNLKCAFCQNYDISQLMRGKTVEIEDLADMMLQLQSMQCHNINLVTPTHQVPFIVKAAEMLGKKLQLPFVYNTSAYDSVDVIKKLDGFIQIYMPDFKFRDPERTKRYMSAPDYPEVAKQVIAEMYRQVGELKVENGVAKTGLLIRHLVMPDSIDDSRKVLEWISENTPEATVNVMAQYSPYFRASEFPEINRRITNYEYQEVIKHAKKLGVRLLEY